MPAYAFNAAQFEPQFGGGGKSLPPGKKYKGVIVDSRQEPTKDGRGGFLAMDIRVIEGSLINREMTLRLNLHNVNAQAVEIANKQLSALCHVTGKYVFQATEELHNIPFLFDVDWQKGNEPSQEKPEGGYTEITALYDVNGNKPGAQAKGATVTQQAAPPPEKPPADVAPASKPWSQQPNGGAAANGGWGKTT